MGRGPHASRIERWEEIYRLKDQGVSMRETARRLGINERTVCRALEARRGYALPARRPHAPEVAQRHLEALQDGWSYREVARTFGICEHALRRKFPGYAWTPQQKSEYVQCLRRLRWITDNWSAIRQAGKLVESGLAIPN